MARFLRIQNDSGNTSLTGAWVNFAPASEVWITVEAMFIDAGAPVAFLAHHTPGSGGVGVEPEQNGSLVFGPDGTIPDFFISGASSIFVDTGYFESGVFAQDVTNEYSFHATATGVTVPLPGGRTGYEWDVELWIDGDLVVTGTLVTHNNPALFTNESTLASLYMTMWGDAVAGQMLIGSIAVGTTGIASDDLLPTIDFGTDAELPDLDGFNVDGDGVIDIVEIDDPVPAGATRFGESAPWRFLVTDLDTVTQALLDRLASNREVVYTLNQACRMSASLPSDSPEVNLLGDDGYPIVAEGVRLLYCFRRENDEPSSDAPIWVIRAAGIILSVDDRGGPTEPVTELIAFDPWQLLYRRPLRAEDGTLPPEGGLRFSAAGSAIVEQIIAFSELVDGSTHLELLTGTIETTDVVTIDFQQGVSVGEALDQLVDTGTLDIVLTPIYDPIGRPGKVCELNVYETAGSIRRAAIFAWDKPGRNLVDLNRQIDGRERVNKLQYYIGQGGPPVPLVSDLVSVGTFGQYWEQQFFPANQNSDVVEGFANLQRRFRKDGLITYSISPAPERSLIPIIDYDIGDYVPIYATNRLRESVSTLKRVYSIPLSIGDDQMEAPAGVIVADDETPEES